MFRLFLKEKKKKATKDREHLVETKTEKREYHRKKLDKACTYRPVGSSEKVRLSGHIKDISLGGVGIEIGTKNTIAVAVGVSRGGS